MSGVSLEFTINDKGLVGRQHIVINKRPGIRIINLKKEDYRLKGFQIMGRYKNILRLGSVGHPAVFETVNLLKEDK